jgi:hypothetical protein
MSEGCIYCVVDMRTLQSCRYFIRYEGMGPSEASGMGAVLPMYLLEFFGPGTAGW